MSKKHQRELTKLKKHFIHNKKKALKSMLLAAVFFFLTLIIVGIKLFYPFHFFVALPFLVLSVSFFFRSFLIDFSYGTVMKSAIFKANKEFLSAHKKAVIWLLIILSFGYVTVKVIPAGTNPFGGMSSSERSERIEDDLQIAVVLLDNLEIAGRELIESPLLTKKDLTADEVEDLRGKWNLFLSVAMESEKLTDVHQYFNRINVLLYPREHAKSFVIAYGLYVKKFELFHRLIGRLNNNERAIKVLNEFSFVFGSKDSYTDVLDRFFSAGSLLKRNLGRTYVFLLDLTKDESAYGENYVMLKEEAKKSQSYLLKNFTSTAVNTVKDQRNDLERGLFKTWFPVQKNVANMMGNFYVSRRHEKLIAMDQILELKKNLQPGDILVERRNWYASNVGIPGFWPHAALYLGTYSEAEKYFSDLFPRDGFESLTQLIEARYPQFLAQYRSLDSNNYPMAVLEGKSPGIILQSIEESAHADYVGVLRPRISQEDKLKSLLRSFENFGKPYDYNFDFETRDELVCSELVYDAYLPLENKRGLKFELVLNSGRKIVSPTDMVKKYYEEMDKKDRELDFVYFLDGNEKLGRAFVKDENDFATSWTRPKYDWFQE